MGKKVIVIDDSGTVREQVSGTLVAAGFDVVEASDGLQGLTVLDENADAVVLVCDLNMPNLGGLDLIARIKARGRNPALSIVMLTTEGDPELVKKAKSAGAKAWIVKPFRPDLLLATVRKLAGAA